MAKFFASPLLRKFVSEQAFGCCEYCLCPEDFAGHTFSVEHIFPKSKGGSNELFNLAFACQGCNGFKHARVAAIDPISLEKVALFHPREHQWADHFRWSADQLLIVGLTPIGRATISVMQLNRQRVVNLRRVLILADEHPPLLFHP